MSRLILVETRKEALSTREIFVQTYFEASKASKVLLHQIQLSVTLSAKTCDRKITSVTNVLITSEVAKIWGHPCRWPLLQSSPHTGQSSQLSLNADDRNTQFLENLADAVVWHKLKRLLRQPTVDNLRNLFLTCQRQNPISFNKNDNWTSNDVDKPQKWCGVRNTFEGENVQVPSCWALLALTQNSLKGFCTN